MIFNIDAQVILGDSIDLSPFVISYTRTNSVCNVSHTAEVKLAPRVLQFLELNEIDINIYEPIHINEYGKRVLTGYVGRISRRRDPVTTISIFITDKYKRAKDYFINDPNWQTNFETLPAMVGTLCDLCGLSLVIDSPELYNVTLPPGEPIGMGTVADAIEHLSAYGPAAIYTDGSGVLHLVKGPRASSLRFTTGETTPTTALTPMELTDGNVWSGTYDLSDENTRDVVSVWGYSPMAAPGVDPRIIATRTADLGLPVQKTAVYSSSLIQTAETAGMLADQMLQELGKFDEVLSVECQGNPKIAILKRAKIHVDLETAIISGYKNITSLNATVSEHGYIMHATFDEFCPKFAAWSLAVPKIYAGLDGNGVYISYDKGMSWADFNNGLPSGVRTARRVAADPFGNAVAIVNDNLYYETNNLWTTSTLPTPVSGTMGTLKTVGALGGYNEFVALTAGTGGSHAFFSTNREPDGVNEAPIFSGWQPALVVYETYDDFGNPINSAINAYDMYTKTGAVYVLGTAATTTSGTAIDVNTPYPGTPLGGEISMEVMGTHLWTEDNPSSLYDYYEDEIYSTGKNNTTFIVAATQGSTLGICLKLTTTDNTHPTGTLSRFKVKGRIAAGNYHWDGVTECGVWFTHAIGNADFYGAGVTASPDNCNDVYNDQDIVQGRPPGAGYARLEWTYPHRSGSWTYTNHWYNTGYVEMKVSLPPSFDGDETYYIYIIIDEIYVEYGVDDYGYYSGMGIKDYGPGEVLLIGPTFTSYHTQNIGDGTPDEGTSPDFGVCVNYGYDPDTGWNWQWESVSVAEAQSVYGAPNLKAGNVYQYTGTSVSNDLYIDSSDISGSLWLDVEQDGNTCFMSTRINVTGPNGPYESAWTSAYTGSTGVQPDGKTWSVTNFPWWVQRYDEGVNYPGVGDYFYGTIDLKVVRYYSWNQIRDLTELAPGVGYPNDDCYGGGGMGYYQSADYYHICNIYGSFTGAIPSGILPTVGSGIYGIFDIANNGGGFLIVEVPAAANSTDRLYVSEDSQFYVYNTAGRLMVDHDYGNTITTIFPTGAASVPAIVRVGDQSITLASGTLTTFIGKTVGTDTSGAYQDSPEVPSGWTQAAVIPSGFTAKDAIWTKHSTQGVLIGGAGDTKIYRYDPSIAPFSAVVGSDTGLPDNASSNVLDLEWGE